MSTTSVTTGKVRFSYVQVFQPKSVIEGGEPKFSVCLIIDKSDKKTLTAIKQAVNAAMEPVKGKFKGGKPPKSFKLPLRDGDEERPDSPEFANSYFLNARSNRKPGLVDARLNPIDDPAKLYSGCYGRAHINFYAFSVPGNSGVAVGLNHLQKTADGDPLGGAVASAFDVFEVEEDSFEDSDILGGSEDDEDDLF